MAKFAIFASGSGSNAQVLINWVQEGKIDAELACLVCDRPGAKVIERAEAAEVPVLVYSPKEFDHKAAYEAQVVADLRTRGVEYIVLAGYLRICGPTFLEAYAGRTINLHPSLLPLFPGLHAIRDAFEAGVKYTGVTVHFIDEGVDTGPIIRQETVMIDPADSLESLAEKIHAAEHRVLPEVAAQFLTGQIRLVNGKIETENK
ncbi:formyltetrahydrofolate-dependent phosphoribosylglycinamide formyltransferase [Tumebacillus sp. BK434]|uniref:phosphoribosylglycinamide formyltransferase n=1 Tax=Tumebacillus sp. BK434 TaxID=2512169 RepID=UPI00104A724F|nr:phosphoribosylglycinamide formyltransferase [Tumebacillus sp. BK434]TCP52360.1 formyltetrahydrofolate-dependent phosphoribosylglycinamide formyltransferase [Tumebacillus sp. BK434]